MLVWGFAQPHRHRHTPARPLSKGSSASPGPGIVILENFSGPEHDNSKAMVLQGSQELSWMGQSELRAFRPQSLAVDKVSSEKKFSRKAGTQTFRQGGFRLSQVRAPGDCRNLFRGAPGISAIGKEPQDQSVGLPSPLSPQLL